MGEPDWRVPVPPERLQAEAERLHAEYGDRQLYFAHYDDLGCCLTNRSSFMPITDMMREEDAHDLLERFEKLQMDAGDGQG